MILACTIGDELEDVVLPAAIEFTAEHQIAEPDIGLSDSYEIRHAKLHVNADLSALVTDCYCVRIESGRAVFISINPEEARNDQIDVDDCDLNDELSDYLMESTA